MITKNNLWKISIFLLFLNLSSSISYSQITLSIDGPSELCVDSCALVTFELSGAFACDVLWSDNSGTTSTSNDYLFCPTISGLYTIELQVTDCDGDVHEESFSIFVNPCTVILNVDAPAQLCISECVTLSANNSGPEPICDYVWNTPEGDYFTETITVCPMEEGEYVVALDAYDCNGQLYEELSIIDVTSTITIEIVSTSPDACPDNNPNSVCEKTCSNSTITYTVPGSEGQDLQWEVIGAESYEVDENIVTVTWGNPGVGEINVLIAPEVAASPLHVDCVTMAPDYLNDDAGVIQAFVQGGIPPYAYSWSPGGSIGPSITDLPNGTYSVTVTDSSGETATCSSTVLELICSFGDGVTLSNADIVHPTQIDCDNLLPTGSINLTLATGVPPFVYYWNTGQTTQDLTNLSSGLYIVTISDQNGCDLVSTFNVECLGENACASNPIYLNCVQLSPEIDGNNEGVAEVQVQGGTPPYTYAYTDVTGTSLPDLINISSGIYFAAITDANGCQEFCSVTINNHDSQQDCPLYPYFGIVELPSNCASNDGFLSAVDGALPFVNATFEWSTGSTEFQISNLSPDYYCLTVTEVTSGCTAETCITLDCGSGNPSGSACTSEGSLCVDIIAEPEASFTTIPIDVDGVVEICLGENISFINTSTNAENYVWQLGDGYSVATENLDYTYEQSGLYDVVLIARNECFCFDTTSLKVLVSDAEIPEISCAGTVCVGDSVTYTTNADCNNFIWTISGNGTILSGGGSSDNFITVDWNAGPEGEVTLQVSNCNGNYCDSPNSVDIPIIADGIPIEGPAQVCPGEISTYSIQEWNGTEYVWSASPFGEIKSGQGSPTVTIKWNVETVVTEQQWVQVVYDNCFLECGGQSTLDVDITPDYYLAGPIEACENSSSEYAALDELGQTPVNCNWTLYDTNEDVILTIPSAAVATINWPPIAGKYTLQAAAVNAADYCNSDYAIEVNVVAAPPIVNGINGTNTICPGSFYTYDVVSTLPNTIFSWEINNGGVLSENAGESINVQWGNSPPYELTVTQTSTEGLICTSLPFTMTIEAINDITVVGASEVCVEGTYQYTAPSIGNAAYNWMITPVNAGTILSGQGTNVIDVFWHSQGNANISVGACGFIENIDVTVFGYPDPIIIHPDSLCLSETGTASTTEVYSSYSWRNESGAVLSSASTANLDPGFYELVVTNSAGCIGQNTFRIEELASPTINISTPGLNFFCEAIGFPPATLYALNTEDGYTYEWFQDGTNLNVNTTSYQPSSGGNFQVIVTDINGCKGTSNTIYLYENCPGGGGGPFPGGGAGCNGDISNVYSTGPTCDHGIFLNTSTSDIPGSVEWNFDDPASGADNFSTLENPEHYFTAAGYYGVQMTVSNINGGTCILHKSFEVPVFAEFDWQPNCPGQAVTFEDISTFTPTGVITNWDWDFGDPSSGTNNTSTLQDPSHIYNTPGNYTVTLVITEQSGCTSTATENIEILPLPVASFDPPALGCEASVLSFNINAGPGLTSFEWNFGDPSSGDANTSRLGNTFHKFSTAGDYDVTLTVYNVYGCSDVMTQSISIVSNNLTGVIDMSPGSPICEGNTTTLTAPSGGTSWIWSDGSTTESITVSDAGIYSVTISDDLGCDYAPPAVVLDIIQAPDGTIKVTEYNEYGQPTECFFDGYFLCEGEDVFLSIDGLGDYSYVWSNGQNGDEVIYDEEHNGTLSVGEHIFTVTVTDPVSGCTSIEGPYSVTVNPIPTDIIIASAPTGPICEETTAVFIVTNPDPDFTYLWSTGEYGTTITASTAGEYYVVAISSFGCEGQSNIIEIYPAPDVTRVPDGCHVHCVPNTICLPPMPDVVFYQWYLNDVPVAAPEGNSPDFEPQEPGTYTLELFDANGCNAISAPLDLELAPINLDSLTFESCAGDDVIFDGQSLPPGSETDFVYTNQFGCDSTITVFVLTDVSTAETIDLSACEGSSVIFSGEEYMAGDMDTVNLVNQAGCDSIFYINVALLPQNNEELILTSCDGSDIIYDGESLPPGSVTEFMFTNQYNCDSIVTVTVLTDETYEETFELSGCDGSMVVFDGVEYPVGSTQELNYMTSGGCDSTIILEIAALTVHSEAVTLNACGGGSVEYMGDILLAGSVTEYPYTNQFNCDSIITVTVVELPTQNETVNLTGCTGETIIFGGVEYLAGTQTILNYTNQQGCDSIINLNIAEIETFFTPITIQGCMGATIEYANETLDVGTTTEFTYSTTNGCDSIVSVTVNAFPDFSFGLNPPDIICWNGNDGLIEINSLNGSTGPFSYSLDGINYQTDSLWSNLSSGDYTVYVQDFNGCVNEEEVSIPTIPEVDIAIFAPTIECNEDSVLVQTALLNGLTDSMFYEWQHGYLGPDAPVFDPGVYVLDVSNLCETRSFEIEVEVEDGYRDNYIYIPNAFSPNGDGRNDVFRAYAAGGLTVLAYELHLFDRWGNTLFVSEHIEDGWDGVFLNEAMNPGVYVWWLRAKVQSCRNEIDLFEKGDVTIMK